MNVAPKREPQARRLRNRVGWIHFASFIFNARFTALPLAAIWSVVCQKLPQ